MPLSPSALVAIELRLQAVEAATGVQVVAAMVRRSSQFNGLRWRAFALGAAVAALATVAEDWLHPGWLTAYTALFNAMVIVGSGITLALLATFVPPFARLFLQRTRAETAVLQRAQTLFLQRGLFATRRRNAVLLLCGTYERAVAVYADTGHAGRVGDAEWHTVVAAMTPPLRRGDPERAYLAGLDALQALLLAKGYAPVADAANDLGDQLIDIDEEPA